MNVKEFFKPTILNILIFVFVAVFYLYFAGESACGASLYFAFCYKAYGFPFLYMVTGDIDSSLGYIKTLFLGEYFKKSGNILFNSAALIFDIALIYLLACFISLLIKNMKARHDAPK